MSRSKRVPGDPDLRNGWTYSRDLPPPSCSSEFAAPVAWAAVRDRWPRYQLILTVAAVNDFVFRCYRFKPLLPLKLSSTIQFDQETLRATVKYYDGNWHLANCCQRLSV
jgi:hypothetical protein